MLKTDGLAEIEQAHVSIRNVTSHMIAGCGVHKREAILQNPMVKYAEKSSCWGPGMHGLMTQVYSMNLALQADKSQFQGLCNMIVDCLPVSTKTF